MRVTHWLAFMAIFSLHILSGSCSQKEEQLVRDLFRGYNKLIRPVQNMTEKVEVAFGLAFIQLINVNEKSQIMKSNVWLRLVWKDYQLQWDEADYGGISVLRLPPDKVWKPDIVLFNNADGNYEVRYKSNVLIYPDGEVLWVPPAIYQSSCTIDVTYFPFDQQTCIMKFGSWTFTGDQVTLLLYNSLGYVDLSDYWKSGTWDIIEVPAYLNVNKVDDDQDDSPTLTDITFYITIRRKTLFYTVNLILPTVLISFLCVLVFYLPAEAGEKVTLGISILLSLVVFLLLVSKILPPTSLVLPLIAKYLLFTFIMNTVSILVTVVIINWNFRGPRTHSMPNWMRVVFLKYMPMVLFMRRPTKSRLRWMMEIPGHNRNVPPVVPPSKFSQPQPGGPMMPNAMPPIGIPTLMGVPTSMQCNMGPPMSSLPPVPPPHGTAQTLPTSRVQQNGNPDDLDFKNNIEVVKLSDVHHPSCKLNQSQGSFGDDEIEPDDLDEEMYDERSRLHDVSMHHHHYPGPGGGMRLGGGVNRHSLGRGLHSQGRESDDILGALLSPKAFRATQAAEFIAEHLRNEDEYVQIREDWKFVAMVVDRVQLWLFFFVTTIGTMSILMDAPYIFEYVDQDAIINLYRGK